MVMRDAQVISPASLTMSICQTWVLRPMCTGRVVPVTQPLVVAMSLFIARELGATDPEEFDIEWPNLEQLTAKEQAELEKIHADTDEIRIGQGFPEETVLLHRHGGDKYRATPPMLTLEDKAALEANLRTAREKPEEEPALPTDPSDPDNDRDNDEDDEDDDSDRALEDE